MTPDELRVQAVRDVPVAPVLVRERGAPPAQPVRQRLPVLVELILIEELILLGGAPVARRVGAHGAHNGHGGGGTLGPIGSSTLPTMPPLGARSRGAMVSAARTPSPP